MFELIGLSRQTDNQGVSFQKNAEPHQGIGNRLSWSDPNFDFIFYRDR